MGEEEGASVATVEAVTPATNARAIAMMQVLTIMVVNAEAVVRNHRLRLILDESH